MRWRQWVWCAAIAGALIGAAVAFAGDGGFKPAIAAEPRLEVPETNFDFGYAPQDATISHVYWLRNVGTDTLRITDVRPGCGCTKAPLKKKELGPGDSTDVEVIFSTGHYSSHVQKTASIISNAPGQAPPLTFTAHPVSDPDSIGMFSIMPPQLDLDTTRPDSQKKPWEYEVAVKNKSSGPFALKVVSAPDRFIKVDVPKGEIEPGNDEAIRIKIASEAADTLFTKSFTIEASDAAKTRYTFPIKKSMRWGPTPVSGH